MSEGKLLCTHCWHPQPWNASHGKTRMEIHGRGFVTKYCPGCALCVDPSIQERVKRKEEAKLRWETCKFCKHPYDGGQDHGELLASSLIGDHACADCYRCSLARSARYAKHAETSGDAINHPSHYTMGNIEVIDAIEAWGLSNDYCLGNVIKYVARAKHKGTFITDLEKAIWYLKRRIKEEKEGGK